MECNIVSCNKEIIKKTCYKTKYKNIVIVRLESKCYSITHYQTGIAISYDRYTSIKKALENLDDVVYKARENLKRNNICLKQFCKQRGLKQINF